MGRYDYMPGINHPYDAGIQFTSAAILNTGADNIDVLHTTVSYSPSPLFLFAPILNTVSLENLQ